MKRADRGQILVGVGILIALILASPFLLRLGLESVQGRGVDVRTAECDWNTEKGRYEAKMAIENLETIHKTALVRVRTRFRPPLGRHWPDYTSRQMNEYTSQLMTLVFEPEGSAEESFVYHIPAELDKYTCTTTVAVLGQRRYLNRPSLEEVAEAPEQIKTGLLYWIRQRMPN